MNDRTTLYRAILEKIIATKILTSLLKQLQGSLLCILEPETEPYCSSFATISVQRMVLSSVIETNV
jgi:hypothetical protein